ncbi:MAG: trypsin-like peptidase domain-containing protein, partial [Anaerolineae bacterium]
MEGKTPDVNKVAWAYTAGALWVIIILGMLVFTPSPSLTFAAPGGGDDDPISLVESFRRLSSAVGALYVQTNDGDMKFNCTVTVIGHEEERTTLITAAHCVSRGETYMISLDGMRFYSARVWKLPPELVKNTATRGYGEPKVDIAILTVRQILAVNPVLVGPDIGTDAGKAVITVGYPLGVTKISYNGIIAGRMTRPGAEKD